MTKFQTPTTLFFALPISAQRPIPGGCQCQYCTANPHRTPMWDTLAVSVKDTKDTWIVHHPEK